MDLLVDGDTNGRYEASWRACAAAMLAAVNAGWSASMFEEQVRRGPFWADVYLKKDTGKPRSEASAVKKLYRDYNKTIQYAADRPAIIDPDQACKRLEEVREAIPYGDWSGRAGLRDRTVLEALLLIAESMGTLHPTVSVRTLTQGTPYKGAITVSRALTALERRGWIRKDPSVKAGAPSGYALLDPSKQFLGGIISGTSHPSKGGRDNVPVLTPPDRYTSKRLALVAGQHAATLQSWLTAQPQSLGALKRHTGFAYNTVKKHINRLARVGLARHTPEGWVIGDTDPETVAFEHGADLQEFERSEKFNLQRDGYRRSRAT